MNYQSGYPPTLSNQRKINRWILVQFYNNKSENLYKAVSNNENTRYAEPNVTNTLQNYIREKWYKEFKFVEERDGTSDMVIEEAVYEKLLMLTDGISME